MINTIEGYQSEILKFQKLSDLDFQIFDYIREAEFLRLAMFYRYKVKQLTIKLEEELL